MKNKFFLLALLLLAALLISAESPAPLIKENQVIWLHTNTVYYPSLENIDSE